MFSIFRDKTLKKQVHINDRVSSRLNLSFLKCLLSWATDMFTERRLKTVTLSK